MKSLFFLTLLFLCSPAAFAGRAIDWKKCQNMDFYKSTIPFTKKNVLKPDCVPEVLYSWRTDVSLTSMVVKQKSGIGPVAGHPNNKIFLSKTPLSSHAYGTTGVRFKLKKNVKFVFGNAERTASIEDPERDCGYYKQQYPKDYDNIVIVSVLGFYQGFSEYILCSDGPIESWSYGTPEQLIEEEKEYSYYKDHPKAGEHENVFPEAPLTQEEYGCPDGKQCNRASLEDRMNRARQLARESKGEIFYMKDITPDRDSHFSTEKQFYYSLDSKENGGNDNLAEPGTKKKAHRGAR